MDRANSTSHSTVDFIIFNHSNCYIACILHALNGRIHERGVTMRAIEFYLVYKPTKQNGGVI